MSPHPSLSYARGWLLRAGVMAGALAYAALAIGSGMDRLAPIRPGMARRVPSLFAANALAVTAEAQLTRAPHAAARSAAGAVDSAPLEPFSTALLGASRAALGDDVGADRAFRVAGQLGWRIPLTQSYWLTAALSAGDWAIAAQHLDALLRQRPDLLRLPETAAPFEASAAGRNALVRQLATRPPWLDWYAGAMDPVPPAPIIARRLPVLLLLGDRGIVLGCAVIAPALVQLIGAGLTSEAAALRLRHCPSQ